MFASKMERSEYLRVENFQIRSRLDENVDHSHSHYREPMLWQQVEVVTINNAETFRTHFKENVFPTATRQHLGFFDNFYYVTRVCVNCSTAYGNELELFQWRRKPHATRVCVNKFRTAQVATAFS